MNVGLTIEVCYSFDEHSRPLTHTYAHTVPVAHLEVAFLYIPTMLWHKQSTHTIVRSPRANAVSTAYNKNSLLLVVVSVLAAQSTFLFDSMCKVHCTINQFPHRIVVLNIVFLCDFVSNRMNISFHRRWHQQKESRTKCRRIEHLQTE